MKRPSGGLRRVKMRLIAAGNAKRICGAHPSCSRSQLIMKGSNTIILDAYNANPSSMKLAIENFGKMEAGKRIVLLGARAELGRETRQEHTAIAELRTHYPRAN